jgi:hypothetical protein
MHILPAESVRGMNLKRGAMTEREWMEHGTHLRVDLLGAADWLVIHRRMTAAERQALIEEVEIRRRIRAHLAGVAVEFGPAEKIWLEFMQGHAVCQVKRQAGDTSEAMFQAQCETLRNRRDVRLKRVKWYVDECKKQKRRYGWKSPHP